MVIGVYTFVYVWNWRMLYVMFVTYANFVNISDTQPCVGFLNQNQQDQMKISGYRRSNVRFLLCWVCICLTGGLLRLVMHWWRHWYLMATCQPCPLQEAQHVLVEEDFLGKHKVYHVKPVHLITVDQLK